MPLFAFCCIGAQANVESSLGETAERGANRVPVPKDSSTRHRNSASATLSQACATACISLPSSSCEQWSQRITGALGNVESNLRCIARLLVVSSDGLPWVFAANDWVADDSDRIAAVHLADVLSQQADGTGVVLRRCRDAKRGSHQVLTWPAGQQVVLEPFDLLAVPLHLPCPKTTAALLLGWERPLDLQMAYSAAHREFTALASSDAAELRRLAHFLGYGLLGDPSHARYVSRVCRHLSLLPAAPSLHDLVTAFLDGLQDLVLAKFALSVQLILAAVHDTASPAVMFSLRAAGPYGTLRRAASDAQAQMNALLGSCVSVSGAAVLRPSAANMSLLAAADGGNSGGGANLVNCGVGGSAPDASRVRAVRSSLAHTLLLQAVRSGLDSTSSALPAQQQQQQLQQHAGNSRDAVHQGSHSYTMCDDSRKVSSLAGTSGARWAPPAAAPGSRPRLQTVVVPNASSHMLEDQQPCRDVLQCSKMAGAKTGSLVLLVEAGSGHGHGGVRKDTATATGTTAELASEPLHRHATQPLPDVRVDIRAASGGMQSSGVTSGTAAAEARPASSSDEGVSGGAGAGGRYEPGVPAAVQSRARASQRPAAFQLGLYLLTVDVLPAGVLRMVVEEMQALLPMFFSAFHATLASCDPDTGRLAADWRRLQDQLLGQLASGLSAEAACGAAATAAVGEPLLPPPPPLQPQGSLHDRCLRNDVQLESPMPVLGSPVLAQRSAGSTQLFKPNRQQPLPTQHSTPPPLPNNGAASPVMSSSGTHGKALKGLAVSQGGGAVRKGVLALLVGRDEGGLPAHHALSTPGSAAGGGCPGYSQSPRSTKGCVRTLESPQIHSISDVKQVLLDPKGSGGSWRLGNIPQVTLERAAGSSALDTLVSSMRHGLTAVGPDDNDDQASQAQDLAAVQLLEVLGRGGQGVVFRGTLHGLETAVKVLTDSSSGQGIEEEARPPQGGQGAGQAAGQAAAGGGAEGEAGAGAGAGQGGGQGSSDTWGADGKAGEARIRQAKRGAMEVAVIGTLSHPSIVQVYATFSGVVVVRCQYHDSPRAEMRLCFPNDDMLAGKDPGPLNQVICLEYCDAGTLLAAARNAAFRQPFAVAANGPAFPALVPLYKSLLEVALALRYLHSRRLVHCDLKAANVLLKSSSRDLRGWTCKLSDFGCARMLTEPGPDGGAPLGFRTAAPVGTLAHMAPECFIKNSFLTTAVDVYSFGVLMWELLMCRTPYAGMNGKEVPRQVIRHNLRPSFHPLAPSEYCALATRCWTAKPERRPTAIDLVGLLEQLLTDAQASAAKESHVAAAAAATLVAVQRTERTKLGLPAAPAGAGIGTGVAPGADAFGLLRQPQPQPQLQMPGKGLPAALQQAAGGFTPKGRGEQQGGGLAAQRPGRAVLGPGLLDSRVSKGAGADGCAQEGEAQGGSEAGLSASRSRGVGNADVAGGGSSGGEGRGSGCGENGGGAGAAEASAICLLPFSNPDIVLG